MARSYSLAGSLTGPNSATLPIANILSPGSVRPKVFEIIHGSSATPSDNAGQFAVRRCSTAGTPGSTPAPAPIDPGDPASLSTTGLATFSVGPTLGTTLLEWGLNQRASFRWACAPHKELVGPATANNGLAFLNPTNNPSPFTVDFTIVFEE